MFSPKYQAFNVTIKHTFKDLGLITIVNFKCIRR